MNFEDTINIDFDELDKMNIEQKTDLLDLYFSDKDVTDDYQMLPQELMTHYYHGYLKSVKELLPKIKNERTLFFPLTFLLSHYMELWIKTIGLFYGMDFNYDMKGLKITGHNIKRLILDPEQLSELAENGISAKELKKIVKKWEYFEKFTENNTELSIAMRYPVMPNENLATIKNYQNYDDFDVDEYISNANNIIFETSEVFHKFVVNEAIDSMKKLEFWKQCLHENSGDASIAHDEKEK